MKSKRLRGFDQLKASDPHRYTTKPPHPTSLNRKWYMTSMTAILVKRRDSFFSPFDKDFRFKKIETKQALIF